MGWLQKTRRSSRAATQDAAVEASQTRNTRLISFWHSLPDTQIMRDSETAWRQLGGATMRFPSAAACSHVGSIAAINAAPESKAVLIPRTTAEAYARDVLHR